MRDNYIAQVKSLVTMEQICERYGFDINSKGFIRCPFHDERTASLKVYRGGRGYYCFGCGSGGDVIDFVCRLFNVSAAQAVIRINEDMALRLPIGRRMTAEERRGIIEGNKARAAQRASEEAYRRSLDDEYYAAMDEVERLQGLGKQKPKSVDEMTPEFIEYLTNKEHAMYRLDMAAERLYYYEHKNDTGVHR